MAEIIDMPKLSDTMTTGTLVTWLKKEGDPVAAGDMLAEIETDKATMELESFADGILLKHYAQVGQQLPVGTPLCAIGEKGEAVPDAGPQAPAARKKAAPAESAPPPAAPPCVPPPPPAADTPAPAPRQTAPAAPPRAAGERVKASPLARKMAAEHQVELSQIQGTGPGGRIVKADILAAAAAPKPAGRPQSIMADSLLAHPQGIAEDVAKPVSGMRSAIARRLLESKQSIPHFYLETEINAAPLLETRSILNRKLVHVAPEKGGLKLTVNDFILKAVAEALRRVPEVNASWMGDHIQQHGSVHVAFGVAVEDGLVTPVIREAHAKSLRQISREAKDLIHRARQRKLKPEDMSGSTFTVTNLGMYGIRNFFGIINPPNAAILSVSAVVQKPVVNAQGQIVVGERMAIGFSGDHRVVDGALGAQFLQAIQEVLETPALMLV